MIAAVREKRRGVVVESVVIVEKNVVRRLGKAESMKNFSGKEGKGRKGREGKERNRQALWSAGYMWRRRRRFEVR
jgi:hypothetical protein